MKLSNTTRRELIARYIHILKKCALLNAAILTSVALAAPAYATAVAKIGETEYETLKEAIDAATSSDEIIVMGDVEQGAGVSVKSGSNLTIDFGNNTYTAYEPSVGSTGTKSQIFQLLKDSVITMKNGTITVAEETGENGIFKMGIQNYADLTLDHITLDGRNMKPDGVNYTLSNNNGTVLIKNSEIIARTENDYAFDVYRWTTAGYGDVSVTVENSKIIGKIQVAASAGEIGADDKHELIISGGELVAVSEGSKIENHGTTTLNDVTLSGNISTGNGAAVLNTKTTNNERGILNLNNTTFTNNTSLLGGAVYGNAASQIHLSGNNIFAGNKAGDAKNDIYTDGVMTVDGSLTLDGGITGQGTLTFKNGATLNATLQSTTILADSIIFEGDNTINLTVANGLANDDYDFITATTSLTGVDQVKIGDNALYNLKLTDDGKISISVKSAAELAAGTAANAQQAAAMAAIVGTTGNGTTTGNAVAEAISTAIQSGRTDAAVQAVEDLAPTTSQVVIGTAQSVNSLLNTLAGNRMATVGRAGGDAFIGGALWAQGLYNHAKQDRSADTAGFDGDTRGIAFGLDGKVNQALTVGIGYGYTNTDADSGNRDIDVDGHNFFAYAEYKPTNWFVNGMLSYGYHKYTEKKNVLGIGMRARYDVNVYAANVMTGYAYDNGLTPEIGARYVMADTQSYNDGAQRIHSDKADVLTGVAGVKYTHAMQVQSMTIRPNVRLAATYDVISDKTKADVNVIGGGNYQITGKRLARFGMETGVGLETTMGDWTMSLNYDGSFRKDYQSHTGTLKAKYNF